MECCAFFPEERDRALRRAWVAGILLCLAVLLLRTAWVCDDAYITFRTIDNFLHGYGLRWNVDERVETYTHPLWMLTVAGAVALTGEFYYTVVVLSITMTLLAVGLICGRLARSVPAALLAVSMLALSNAFSDYSTSGLEYPLTYLLLAIFFIAYWSDERHPRRVLLLVLTTGLILTNRIDTGLLVLPALFSELWRRGVRRHVIDLVAGLSPFAAWEIFALIYYGFPVPNTAYAKLTTGIPAAERLSQGLLYLLALAGQEPISLVGILVPAAVAMFRPRSRPFAAGLFAYLVYIVAIGGDFMGGRFLADPLLASAAMVATVDVGTLEVWAMAMAVVWVIGWSATSPTLQSDRAYGAASIPETALRPNGVNDERRYYYPSTGLLTARRGVRMPHHRWIALGERVRERVSLTDAAGFVGFAAGPAVHYVDRWALADPLLARLPVSGPWRVGHYERELPPGYWETLVSGRNRIADPGLARYYDALRSITTGPIWSRARWASILEVNLGRYDRYLDSYASRHRAAASVR